MHTIRSFFKNGSAVLLVIVIAQLLTHLLSGSGYGMFRDEFYYIECAKHLDWGYVDHPPLSIAALAGSMSLLGDSAAAIRILPALIGALLVLIVWFMTGDLGGGLFAKTVAALATAIAPELLGLTGFFSMNAFDLLFWAIAYAVLIRILKIRDGKSWLLMGVVTGLGLLNKISMLFFLFSLFVGLLLTRERRQFREKYIWIGGCIALALFLPYILWQIPKHWPTLEFMANAQKYKIADLSPLAFIQSTVLSMHPLNVFIWLPGLGFLLFAPRMRPYRILGFIFLITLTILLIQKSKPYYLASAFSVLFAAGGVAVEWMTRNKQLRWTRSAIMILLIAGGVATVPFAVPVLPVDRFIAYQKAVGINPPQEENSRLGQLPQFYADCFGWENMARTVSEVYRNLTPEQKTDCAVFGRNYGEAGAINYFRSKYELPNAISEHNNCYYWGPGNATGRTIIAIGINPEDWRMEYESVTLTGTIVSPYAMPYETNLPVYVCVGLKTPIEQAWGPPNFL